MVDRLRWFKIKEVKSLQLFNNLSVKESDCGTLLKHETYSKKQSFARVH